MAGTQIPIGIDTVNPVPADYKYGPYASLAAAKAAIPLALRFDGLIVQITGLGNYWWLAADLTDTGLIAKGNGAFSLPIVRYVELVQNASDVTLMGGAASNVYNTTQAAYDAAVVLQVANGGKVVIKVGNTTAATVGNLVLAAAHNVNVEWVGISANDSVIGTITGNFATNARFSNITIGTITTTTAAITLNLLNATCGILTTSDGGAVSLTLNNSVCGNIVTTTATANPSGNITLTSCMSSAVGTITQNASLANVGTLTVTNCADVTVGTITRNQTSAVANFSVGVYTQTGCDNVRFGAYTSTMAFATSTGANGGLNINSTNKNTIFSGAVSILGHNVANVQSDVTVTTISLVNVTFTNTFHVNSAGASGTYAITIRGGRITTLSIDSCIFSGAVSLGYNTINTAAGTVSIINSRFDSTANFGLRFLWNKVTLTSFSIKNCVADSTTTSFSMFPENAGTSSAFVQQLVLDNSTFTNIVIGVLATTAGTETVPNYLITRCSFTGSINSIAMYKATEVAKLVNCVAENGFSLEDSSGVSAVDSYIYGCPHIHIIDTVGQVSMRVKSSYMTGQLVDLTTYVFFAYTSTLDFTVNSTAGGTYDIQGTFYTSNLILFATATQTITNNNSFIVTV